MLYVAHIHNNFQKDRLIIETYYTNKEKQIYLGTVISREISGIEQNYSNIYFCLTSKNKVHLTFEVTRQCSKTYITSTWYITNFYPIIGENLQLLISCLHMDFKYIMLSYLGYTNEHTRKKLFDYLE